MILSIETATSNCSVALHAMDGTLLALAEKNAPNIHASQLFLFIAEVMKALPNGNQDLKAIAVGKGPGSYTGLRIGVSAAKGLCYSLNIPLLSVNTLQAMAFTARNQIQEKNILFVPMLDARRMEVYNAVFNEELETLIETRASIIDESGFEVDKDKTCCFFGDGMPKCKTILSQQNNAIFIDDLLASAEAIGPLALKKFQANNFEDTAYFEPFYLKEFVSQSQFHKK